MSKQWKQIGRYKVINADGAKEEITLESDESGNFRIKNDFGNMTFEFDGMSGIEFARRLFEDVRVEVEKEMDAWWNKHNDSGKIN